MMMMMMMIIFERICQKTTAERSSLEGWASVLRLLEPFKSRFEGIKLSIALQQMISMIGQCAHGFANLILMGFASLKMRIWPPVSELCHIEIWRFRERNTGSVGEKYISTKRWQIQSQFVRNPIQRNNAVMLVWTEIPRQLHITVQMQAQMCKYKYANTITQIQSRKYKYRHKYKYAVTMAIPRSFRKLNSDGFWLLRNANPTTRSEVRTVWIFSSAVPLCAAGGFSGRLSR